MTTRSWRLRLAGLLAGGAFALHQLRYLVGYGDRSHDQLGSQGHGYMALLAPLVAVALMVAVGDFCTRLARARARRRADAAPRPSALWASASGWLFAAYAIQETLEGALAPGHPAGLAGVVGHGGWTAAPLALALGLAIALLVHGSQGAIQLAAEPAPRALGPRAVLSIGVSGWRGIGARRLAALRPSARAPPLVSNP